MKYLAFALGLLSVLFVVSCEKEDMHDDDHGTNYEYHAHIISPTTDAKHLNDTISIKVDFESHTGETVHHINVKIFNKLDSAIVYDMPTEAHVHSSGSYSHEDNLILSDRNGFSGHSDWIMEARVWGHEAGEEEVLERIEFHVHP
jgi:hypothetical protein